MYIVQSCIFYISVVCRLSSSPQSQNPLSWVYLKEMLMYIKCFHFQKVCNLTIFVLFLGTCINVQLSQNTLVYFMYITEA